MQITIEILDDTAHRLSQRVDNLPRRILESLVIEAYRDELINHAEVRRVLNLPSRWETNAFLKRGEAYLHYTEVDLQQDRETLRHLKVKQS